MMPTRRAPVLGEALTERQQQVWDASQSAPSAKHIARDLGIAPGTVENALRCARVKLGAPVWKERRRTG